MTSKVGFSSAEPWGGVTLQAKWPISATRTIKLSLGPGWYSSSKQTMHVHGFCYSSGGCHGGEAWHPTTPKLWGGIKDEARGGKASTAIM
ncbi:unnamed protein product [Trifolium pratense]|uniref:Uncharacterized protein n=1 Tax=Trifolium pratense TaxID=57577 RepID=A0ACB0IWG1_TRIPR|nr:unnamed protein product [Trifolium pratense]